MVRANALYPLEVRSGPVFFFSFCLPWLFFLCHGGTQAFEEEAAKIRARRGAAPAMYIQSCNLALSHSFILAQELDTELREQILRHLHQQLDFIFPDGVISPQGSSDALVWLMAQKT